MMAGWRALAFILLAGCGGAASGAAAADGKAGGKVVFSEGFEKGLDDWETPVKNPKVKVGGSSTAVAGKRSAEVSIGDAKALGRWTGVLFSEWVPARKGTYKLFARVQFPESFGMSINLGFYDAKKRKINSGGQYFGSAPRDPSAWQAVERETAAYSDETAFLRLDVYVAPRNRTTFRIDDVRVEFEEPRPLPPPWTPQYKIRPDQAERLTEADVVGPDGVVYPNFARAGVRPGVMDRPERRVVDIGDFGARPGDGRDVYPALMAALKALPPEGGVVSFGPGDYRLSRFVRIDRDGIVLRGAGAGQTKIDFDYDAGDNRVDLYGVVDGMKLRPGAGLLVFARPAGLESLALSCGGREIKTWRRSLHSGNESMMAATLPDSLAEGPATLTATAVYADGEKTTDTAKVVIDKKKGGSIGYRRPMGAIVFGGARFARERPRHLLAGDGRRGERVLRLESAGHGLRPGDIITVNAPTTPRWRAETRNACTWGTYRNYLVEVADVKGAEIVVDMPMRIDFPVIDGAFVRQERMVRGGGIEEMTLEMKTDYWVDMVSFEGAVDCWARNVDVIRCGRNPIYAGNAKNCSILGGRFDDAWFKGGGGTAYVGWERSYDCLIDGIETSGMRHAPVVQWSAAGNVIRNSVFRGSDAQWHSGWTNENLFENCVVVSDTTANGGYGNGLWASPPEDGSHGPNGPRNVVYNCDVYSLKTGVELGGMNENWIFAHNRLRVREGNGFFFKTASFDHIVKGNVVVLEDGKSALALFGTADCGGAELMDNVVYGGGGKLSDGLSEPLAARGNRFEPFDADAPRPAPEVPSIYAWQRDRAATSN